MKNVFGIEHFRLMLSWYVLTNRVYNYVIMFSVLHPRHLDRKPNVAHDHLVRLRTKRENEQQWVQCKSKTYDAILSTDDPVV